MAEAFAGFYRGRRVFITGHTGFKGSWLTQWLVDLGAIVKGYALRPPTEPSHFGLLGVEKAIEHVIGDVRDPVSLQAALASFRPDVVFHLAAQPLVRRSYREPRETFETNVMGTVHLLESVRTCPSVRSVVCVTTDKCYENREWLWGYRESDALGGNDPYSASKACVEILASAWRTSFFGKRSTDGTHRIALATARAGNVIGGGDWAEDRLVPDCIAALSQGQSVRVRNPRSARPWQHVLEPLAGYLLLATKMSESPLEYAQGWNFGPSVGDSRTVEWVVQRLCNLWPGGGTYRIEPDASMSEAAILRLDCSKAILELKWSPRWVVEDALRKTVEWHVIGGRTQDYATVTRAQIAEYAELMAGPEIAQ